MTKAEFLQILGAKLEGLPRNDIDRSLDFYAEMIDDRVEDGMSEDSAVAELGSTEEIAGQILMEASLPKLVKAKMKPKRTLQTWQIVLLIVGSPVWGSLLLAAVIVVFALFIVLWAVVVTFYAVAAALGGVVIGCFSASVALFVTGNYPQALFLSGAGAILVGVAIFWGIGCNWAAVGVSKLCRAIVRGIKSCFAKKGETA